MAVWLNATKIIEAIPLAELEYIHEVCRLGIIAALREGDLKAYFIFATKEQAYEKAIRYSTEVAKPDSWLKKVGIPTWMMADLFYPEGNETCEFLEPYYIHRFPGPAFA